VKYYAFFKYKIDFINFYVMNFALILWHIWAL